MHIEYKKQHKRHKYYKYKYFCSPTLCLVRQNDHSLDPIVKTNAILIQKTCRNTIEIQIQLLRAPRLTDVAGSKCIQNTHVYNYKSTQRQNTHV